MQAGASEAKIAEVTDAATSQLFGASEKAALEYAEAMTFTDRKVTDQLFARVRVHLTETQIVDLTASVALANFRSNFTAALCIGAQGVCARSVGGAGASIRRAP